MIQRIQTLYLLLVTILMGTTLLFPIATFTIGNEEIAMTAFTFSSDKVGDFSYLSLSIGIALILSALLPFIVIFLFKHRMLQIRLCGIELALLVGDIALMVASYIIMGDAAAEIAPDSDSIMGFVVVMPVASLILTVLAMRATLRDELIVRSLDRIR